MLCAQANKHNIVHVRASFHLNISHEWIQYFNHCRNAQRHNIPNGHNLAASYKMLSTTMTICFQTDVNYVWNLLLSTITIFVQIQSVCEVHA